jgi:hypothetical protein
MAALPIHIADNRAGRGNPVSHTATGLGRTRGRRKQVPHTLGGRLWPAYAIYDAGQLIGTIVAPDQKPAFGAAAPTVLLVRSEM